jgi:CheY-like chemotaxis protein
MPYKLLIADDSVTIQRVIELTFAEENVRVTAVGDGQAAVDRITADPPDIVLADVGMPVRDGYEVAAFVKNSPHLAHIPVLLLTGAFEPVDEARAAEVRCDGVLAKPFEPQLLISRVKELLAAGAADAAPGEAQQEGQAGVAPEATTALGVFSRPQDAEEDRHDIQPARPAGRFTEDDFSLGPDPGVAATAGLPSPADVSLDDYFDRLDAAFANLSGTPAGGLKEAVTSPPHGIPDTSWAPSLEDSWIRLEEDALASRRHATPSGEIAAGAAEGAAGMETAGTPQSPAKVPVADAFAALLEAEQQGVASPAQDGEMTLPIVPFGTPVITDALVEQIAERVVARIGGDALREVVARVVSETAERLVRQEIGRIKGA